MLTVWFSFYFFFCFVYPSLRSFVPWCFSSTNHPAEIKKQNNIIYILAPQDPGDSRPMLLISGSDRIVITHLNGTGLQPLRSPGVNGTLTLDFQHNQESVCWVLSTDSFGQLRCAEMRNLRGFTREREIRTQQSLQSAFLFFILPFIMISTTISYLSISCPYFSDKIELLPAVKLWTLVPVKPGFFSAEIHITLCTPRAHTHTPFPPSLLFFSRPHSPFIPSTSAVLAAHLFV